MTVPNSRSASHFCPHSVSQTLAARMTLPPGRMCTGTSLTRFPRCQHKEARRVTAAATGRYPRHRPRLRGPKLAALRTAAYARDSYRCTDCGRDFGPPPDGWDGTSALCILVRQPPAPGSPRPFTIIQLELGHLTQWQPREKLTLADIRSQCGPCNLTQGPRKGGRA
jgi:5-methylcytosine-specific restriction endonuclease McrA